MSHSVLENLIWCKYKILLFNLEVMAGIIKVFSLILRKISYRWKYEFNFYCFMYEFIWKGVQRQASDSFKCLLMWKALWKFHWNKSLLSKTGCCNYFGLKIIFHNIYISFFCKLFSVSILSQKNFAFQSQARIFLFLLKSWKYIRIIIF